MPPGPPLVRKRTLTASDLADEELIVMQAGHCVGDQVLTFCDRHDLHHHISFRGVQLETIRSLVRAGLGISLIPAMVAKGDRKHVPDYRSLHSLRPSRQIVAVWPKQRLPSRTASEFLKLLPTSFKKRQHRTSIFSARRSRLPGLVLPMTRSHDVVGNKISYLPAQPLSRRKVETEMLSGKDTA